MISVLDTRTYALVWFSSARLLFVVQPRDSTVAPFASRPSRPPPFLPRHQGNHAVHPSQDYGLEEPSR